MSVICIVCFQIIAKQLVQELLQTWGLKKRQRATARPGEGRSGKTIERISVIDVA